MRGASALEELLEGNPGAPWSAIVVWEPVLESDLAPPAESPVRDPRAAEVWDPDRTVSAAIVAAGGEEGIDRIDGVGVVAWDLIALFPPGARWTTGYPRPAYQGAPVVRAIGEVRRRLGAR